jgi:hypothetical protein
VIVPYSSFRKNSGQSRRKCKLAKRINPYLCFAPAKGLAWLNCG